jgi:hypothetical protein
MATLFKYVNGQLVEMTPEETLATIREHTENEALANARLYIERRVSEYPPIGDQLDAIWKWLADQPIDKEAKIMYNRIKEIKEKYPK